MRLFLTSLLTALLSLFVLEKAEARYTGYGYYSDEADVAPIYIDDNGRISIGERIEVGITGNEKLVASSRGTHILAVCGNFHFRNIRLDKRGGPESNELVDLEGYAYNATISADGRYALLLNLVKSIFNNAKLDKRARISSKEFLNLEGFPYNKAMSGDVKHMLLENAVEVEAYIQVYRIQDNDMLTSTGHFFPLSNDFLADDIAISRIKHTVLATRVDNSPYVIAVLRLTQDERLIDTGQRLSLEPIYCYRLSMSPDGTLCANRSLNNLAFLRIAPDGTVYYNREYMPFEGTAVWDPVFTADGKFMIVPEDRLWYIPTVHSFRILPGGGFEKVAELSGFLVPQTVVMTPDEKYAFIAHNFMFSGQQTLSLVRVYPDGTLKNMLTDITVPGCFFSVVFPPPWLLAEYGVEGDELADFSEWTAGGAPGSFQVPAMKRGITGMPELRATSPGPCFGFWQSPEDACMIVPRSLYRARFVLSTWEDGIREEEESFSEDYPHSSSSDPLPTLRLRIGTQNQHQAAALSLNVHPEDWLAPTPEGMAYEVLIEPPFSLLRQEEDLDDLFLALDLLGFSPDVDTSTSIVVEKAWMDRIPIDALTTAALFCDYSFESDPEGWTSGGARELLSEPIARWTKGTLVLEATTNTDCFGFWQNPAGDIVTSTGAELYRATFEVRRSEVTDIVHVPVFRVRLNSEDGKLAAVLTVGGTACEEEEEWTALKPYVLYYLKPQTPEPMQLRLAFDLLNYDPYAPLNATLELHHVTMERLELPSFPMDR